LVGRVTSLHLCRNDFTGPVPDAFGSLSSLQHLDLSYNNTSAMFPTALYRCRSLQYLDLSHNYLEGELLDDIGQGLGRNLSTLHLNSNRFNGSIPIVLGELTSLQTFWLGENPFDPGELPASFRNLTHLVSLDAESCNIVGAFPSYLVDRSHTSGNLGLQEPAGLGSVQQQPHWQRGG
jgi:Leucine-rich repeat (LRR) protein